MTSKDVRIERDRLCDLFATLLRQHGLRDDMAASTAEILGEADLLGHRTHGAALVPIYLDSLRDWGMARDGAPDVIAARGASQFWEGNRLPGAWLTLRAIEAAEAMARDHGTGTVVVRHSFHIGCLAAYLQAVAERGLVLSLQCSAQQAATVAPHGGRAAVLSPSPVAMGYPTAHGPVMIDISTSVTSNSNVRAVARAGGRLPHPWVIGPDGKATDDPNASEVILPLGGLDAGHKGFGLGLMVEALTGGLAGKGRDEPKVHMAATVFVQVIDPEAFGGLEAMSRAMGLVTDLCHATEPIDPARPVRLPGEAGLRRKAEQLSDGILVDRALLESLQSRLRA